jgi:hypothetical protein
MFVRPTRQATTRSPHEAGQVLVHRNELNEQHRPGALVLFPQSFKESKEEKATTRWIPKLIRQLTLSGDGSGSLGGGAVGGGAVGVGALGGGALGGGAVGVGAVGVGAVGVGAVGVGARAAS